MNKLYYFINKIVYLKLIFITKTNHNFYVIEINLINQLKISLQQNFIILKYPKINQNNVQRSRKLLILMLRNMWGIRNSMGSGLYTGDSNVYCAAKHSGLVPGRFRRINMPACSQYLGTYSNGITTINYGNYNSSFFLFSLGKSQVNVQGSVDEIVKKIKQMFQHSLNEQIKKIQLTSTQFYAQQLKKVQPIFTQIYSEEIQKIQKTWTEQCTVEMLKVQTQYSQHFRKQSLANSVKIKEESMKDCETQIERIQKKYVEEFSEEIIKTQRVFMQQLRKNLDQCRKEQQNMKKDTSELQRKELTKTQKTQTISPSQQISKMHLLYTQELKKHTETILHSLDKQKLLCSICMSKQRQRLVFPCFHAHYCEQCVQQVKQKGQCFICKVKVSGDMKICL